MPNLLQPAYSLALSAHAGIPAFRAQQRSLTPVALRRQTILIWSAILVLLLIWSAASTSYILFRDKILHDIRHHYAFAHHAALIRNNELRLELDHLKAERMTDRAVLGDEIDQLTKRQALLQHRQTALREIGGASAGTQEKLAALAAPTPVPAPQVSDTVRLMKPQQPPRLSRSAVAALPKFAASPREPHTGRLAMLARGYDAVEASQSAALQQFEHKLDRQRDKLEAIYRHIGTTPPSPGEASDVGGPYIPISAGPIGGDTAFNRTLMHVVRARLDIQRLRQGLVHIPLGAPLPDLIETSSFGAREDPFYGSLAFHPGIDLRAAVGSEVHATASGKVTVAGWTGGYGNMVEIDHGHGLRTRYGHLSKIDVKVGEEVAMGETVGRTGSTGRSTGPHLHYEVRIDGKAVDPTRFVTAEHRLAMAYGVQAEED